MPKCRHYEMTIPCSDCPFRKSGGIRLTPGRVKGILASDAPFWCHKSVGVGADKKPPRSAKRVCAGSLIFRERTGLRNLIMLLATRLGFYDRSRFVGPKNRSVGKVFGSVREMLKAQPP